MKASLPRGPRRSTPPGARSSYRTRPTSPSDEPPTAGDTSTRCGRCTTRRPRSRPPFERKVTTARQPPEGHAEAHRGSRRLRVAEQCVSPFGDMGTEESRVPLAQAVLHDPVLQKPVARLDAPVQWLEQFVGD